MSDTGALPSPPPVSGLQRSSLPIRPPESSRATLELAVHGTAVPLLFAELDGRYYVVPTEPPGGWFSGAAREGVVELRLPDGQRRKAVARVREEADLTATVRAALDSRYGPTTWITYFARSMQVLELDPKAIIEKRDDVDRIRGEFDAVAASYNARVARDPVEAYLKERVTERALEALAGRDPILEIGPGTGLHTLPLLQAGHTVVAVELSERMIDQLRRAAAEEGLTERLEIRHGSAARLEETLRDLGPAAFAGAFSAFGAFDLEPRAESVARGLARVVQPGGRLAFTSLNRPGVSPLLWELALTRFSAAGARLNRSIPAHRIRYPLPLYPRNPADWDRVMYGSFARESVEGLSVLAPPFRSDLAVRFLGIDGGRKLKRWDRWLASQATAWPVAEWMFLTYRRRGNGGAESA